MKRTSKDFMIIKNALSTEATHELCDAMLALPYLGKSPLVGTFESSHGFGLSFTDPERMLQRFALLQDFWNMVQRGTELLPFWQCWRQSNAYYLNLLQVLDGCGVGAHIDATLAGQSGVPDANPRIVSVLYLRTPKAGGELLLWSRGQLVGHVTPQLGMLLHFRGHLTHEILPSEGERVSLVCEQYCFLERARRRLPELSVKSKGYFERVLQAKMREAGF